MAATPDIREVMKVPDVWASWTSLPPVGRFSPFLSLSRNNYEVGTAPRMRSGPRQKAAFRWLCEVQRKRKKEKKEKTSSNLVALKENWPRELWRTTHPSDASARQIKTLPLSSDSSFSARRVPPLSALRSDLFTGSGDSFGSLEKNFKKEVEKKRGQEKAKMNGIKTMHKCLRAITLNLTSLTGIIFCLITWWSYVVVVLVFIENQCFCSCWTCRHGIMLRNRWG